MEKYLISNMSKLERSHLAQFRFGILPIRIETGRFTRLNISERVCQICNNGSIEDEIHFLLTCPACDDLRGLLISRAQQKKV